MKLYSSISRFISNASTDNLRKIKSKYNAVIIGGGHNGLVCAAYLQRAGLDVCVLEKRLVVGGAAVTEEIVPGFKFSRASYVLSLFRPQIIIDLELKARFIYLMEDLTVVRNNTTRPKLLNISRSTFGSCCFDFSHSRQMKNYGLKVYKRNPSSYTPLHPSLWEKAGSKSLTLGSNMILNAQQIAKFSHEDAKVYAKYEALVCKLGYALDTLIDLPPCDVVELLETTSAWNKMRIAYRNHQIREVASMLWKLGPNIPDLYEFLTSPSLQILQRWFSSEPLIATLATDSVIGFMASPDMPGTGYVLLHHMMGELEGVRGAWGYPEGGMGAVSQALAASAEAKGAQIFTNTTVKKVKINSLGHATGVVLDGDLEIDADIVISNATPNVTFLDLIPARVLREDFLHDVKRIDYSSPVTKINVAVNRLPNFAADPSKESNTPMPHHQCTIHLNCEHSDKIFEAYQDATHGKISKRPMIEMVIPSSLDSTLAPPGCHVCLIFTQYTPYSLADGRQWDEQTKEEYANIVFDCIEEYAPGFKNSIVGQEVLSPPDLEHIFGLTGGNIFHGAMPLHQLFLSRPTPSRISQSEESCSSQGRTTIKGSPLTPVPGLLLCGSGAHPGGGVMGAPGRLAARTALQVLKQGSHKG